MRKTALIIPYSKIKSYSKLFQDKNTVLVGGCFDLIHYGHLQFLKKAKASGDFLIVALESDEFIIKNKNKKPIHTQKERGEILISLSPVDMVVNLPLFSDNKDYFELVSSIKPKTIAVTDGDTQLKNKKLQAETVSADVKVVTPLLKKYSTRQIINDYS